jgi:hypothetical protein
MLLVYCRLYITLALAQFLFALDLSNVWLDICRQGVHSSSGEGSRLGEEVRDA